MVSKGLGVDAGGNLYQAAMTAIPLTMGNFTTPTGKSFLVKYNNQGNVIWVSSVQRGVLYVENLHTQPNGDTYLTGYIRDTVVVAADTLICKGRMDMFVAKFDSAGNSLWARRAGGIGRNPSVPPPFFDEDGGTAITADSLGNVFVAGYFWARSGIVVNFDSIQFTYPPLHSFNGQMGFLAKYNSLGKIQWVQTVQDIGPPSAARGIAATNRGEVYLTGNLNYNLTFGPGGPLLSHQGNSDVWYAKYGGAGTLGWAKSFGQANQEIGNDIAVNRLGQFFITGYFKNNSSIGPFPLTSSHNNSTLFLAKFDSLGNVMQVGQSSGLGSIGDAVLVIDKADNAYVGASYSGSISFGQQILPNAIHRSPAILKWNSAGHPEKAAYSSGSGTSYGIALNPAGTNCYLSGYFDGNLTFGSHSVSSSGAGFFLASLGGIVNGIRQDAANTLRLYPNPTRDLLYLDLPEATGTVTVKITDLQGRDVLSKQLTAGPNTRLLLPSLAKGVYLVSVQTRKQVLRQKLVIE